MQTRSLWIASFLAGLLFVLPAAARDNDPTTADESSSSTVATAAANPQDVAAGAPAAADQTTPPATPPAADQTAPPAAPAAPPVWSLGPIDFSGTVDGYYGFNFNHPRDYPAGSDYGNSSESNFLYNFNVPTNQFSLNLIKLGMSHSPDPVGFEFDLAYGDTMDIIGAASEVNGKYSEFDHVVEQAYVSWKPAKAKGLELDFGKFVTSASAEVIETYNDWNYSRSLLFSYAVPYFHFGLRASIPAGKHWVLGAQLVNGWNNDTAFNTGATISGNATVTYTKWNWVVDTYDGPGNYGTNSGWRELIDTTLNFTPNSKFAAYINYDYDWFRVESPEGSDYTYSPSFDYWYKNNTLVHWQGIAGAIHYTPNKWALSARYEYFDDPEGFALLGQSLGSANQEGYGTPVANQDVQEVTGTVEYKFLEGLMWRGEYRVDWSNAPFFLTGFEPTDPGYPADLTCSPAACPSEFGLGNSKHQQTLTIGIIAFFGPKR